MPSFIQDSQSLIQKCETLQIPKNCFLVSADFESLYTYIDPSHVLTVLTEFMSDKLNSIHLNPAGFHNINKRIFNKSIFNKRRRLCGVVFNT